MISRPKWPDRALDLALAIAADTMGAGALVRIVVTEKAFQQLEASLTCLEPVPRRERRVVFSSAAGTVEIVPAE